MVYKPTNITGGPHPVGIKQDPIDGGTLVLIKAIFYGDIP